MVSRIDDFGTSAAYNHYAVGWAHAMDTPYQWTKQVASHWGGTRNGTIVHWPDGIEAKGEVRNQFHHVIDVAPTVLEAAGLPEPTTVHGVRQKPIEGVSMRYAFDDAGAPERRETQYFEMFCNRGIYHKGWTGVTRHSTPWVMAELPPLADDTWELYDTNSDWSQAHDLAAEMPEKLEELKALFMEEARKYNVLPLDDRRVSASTPTWQGAPSSSRARRNCSFRRHGPAERELRPQHQEQVPLGHRRGRSPLGRRRRRDHRAGRGVRQAGACTSRTAGRSTVYNFFGLRQFHVDGDAEIPPGTHQVRMEFAYDGGGLGKGGTVSLYVDGKKAGEGRVEGTVPMVFSADETCDVGSDTASAVSDDYTPEESRFTGTINWVQIDIAESAEDLDHLITPEERFQIAMTRQ